MVQPLCSAGPRPTTRQARRSRGDIRRARKSGAVPRRDLVAVGLSPGRNKSKSRQAGRVFEDEFAWNDYRMTRNKEPVTTAISRQDRAKLVPPEENVCSRNQNYCGL